MPNKKKILFGCGIVSLAVILAVVVGSIMLRIQGRQYVKEIREEALSRVRTLSQDDAWIRDKVETSKGSLNAQEWPDCLFEGLIVLPTGEWMAYYYRTSKQDSFLQNISCVLAGECPYDIFIGKASDGKWYTTKYHFCLTMLMLQLSGPAASLDSFKQEYELTEMADPGAE
jgi:hypothetical protein